MTVLWVLVVTLAVSAVIAVLVVRSGRGRAAQHLTEVPGPVRRSTAATSLGVERQGSTQVRGTGTLVLTDSEVAFAQWRPDHLVRIPLHAITQVDTTHSHLGKTMKDDLLRIRWSSADPSADPGAHQTIAVFVRELDPWLADLGGTRSTEEDRT